MTPLLPAPKVSAPTLQGTHGPTARGYAQAPKGPSSPQGRSKKKSRKHQRFMERRALLEQKGLLSPRGRLGNQTPEVGLEALTALTKANGTTAPRCDKVPKPKRIVSASLSPSASPQHSQAPLRAAVPGEWQLQEGADVLPSPAPGQVRGHRL